MKKLIINVNPPIGHTIEELTAAAKKAAPITSEGAFDIDSELTLGEIADIDSGIINIRFRANYNVNITSTNTNGIIIALIGLFTARNRLNMGRYNSPNRWIISAGQELTAEERDTALPYTQTMTDFLAAEQPTNNSHIRETLATIPLDDIIYSIHDETDPLSDGSDSAPTVTDGNKLPF